MYFQKTSSLLLQFLSPLWIQSQQREITRVLKIYQLCLLKEIKEMSVLLQFLFSTQQRKQKSSHLYPVFFLFLESMLLMHICNGKRRQGDQFKKILLLPPLCSVSSLFISLVFVCCCHGVCLSSETHSGRIFFEE